MFNVIIDALIDTLKTVPLLFLIYLAIEYFEFRYSKKMRELTEKAGNAGPAIGAVTGSFPQCGFSVIISALYTQRLVTMGTLLAVYISTSDEAIPIILSEPKKAGVLLPLILTKIFLALFVGYLIDLIFRKRNKRILDHQQEFEDHKCHHNHNVDEVACCGHEIGEKLNIKDLIIHPLVHTARIFFFLLIASFTINYIFFALGDEGVRRLFLGHSIFQPVLTALIGLIPNCAASVAVTEMYLKGIISYGSVVAGLSAGGGLGLLVLFKENKNLKDTLLIITLLFGFSTLAGILIQFFVG